MAEPLTLINAFEVPADEADRFIAAWKKARGYLATQPGYVDTALHQAVGPEAEFQFVNIARWRSAEDFAAAIGSTGFPGIGGRPCRVPPSSRPVSHRAQLSRAAAPVPCNGRACLGASLADAPVCLRRPGTGHQPRSVDRAHGHLGR